MFSQTWRKGRKTKVPLNFVTHSMFLLFVTSSNVTHSITKRPSLLDWPDLMVEKVIKLATENCTRSYNLCLIGSRKYDIYPLWIPFFCRAIWGIQGSRIYCRERCIDSGIFFNFGLHLLSRSIQLPLKMW